MVGDKNHREIQANKHQHQPPSLAHKVCVLKLLCGFWRFYAGIDGRRFFIKKQTMLTLKKLTLKKSRCYDYFKRL